MGQTADELRQEIDSKRQDASQKIEQIEQKVTGTADQVKEQVMQTKDQVMQTFDWRQQVQERPLVAVGAAFLGGVVLGNIMGGDDHDRYRGSDSSFNTVQSQERGMGSTAGGGGMMASIRHAAKSSGLEETVGGMAAGLMGTLSDRMKKYADEVFPGMAEKIQGAKDRSQSGSGTMGGSISQPSTFGTSAGGTTSAGTVDYARGGETGSSLTNG